MARYLLHGNYAAAYGAKMARVDVIAAYPITPQTSIVEKLAEMIANCELDAEYITVESEHSAMAALLGASATGARTFTATATHGLLLMHELLHWATGQRAPIVMVNVNRAVAPPWSIWAEHTDSMAQRDTGWIQYYCENSQEVFDTILKAYKVAENHKVLLPVMVNLDAFFLSHTLVPLDIPEQERIDEFLPSYVPAVSITPDNPILIGSLSMPQDWYIELRHNIAESMENAKQKIMDVEKEFTEFFNRGYNGLIDKYYCDDADIILIAAGTIASLTRDVVDELRNEGKKVGLARMRVFRPFPKEELLKLSEHVSTIAVVDRAISFGYEGHIYSEVKSALYGTSSRPNIYGFVAGLGGRDVTLDTIRKIFIQLLDGSQLDENVVHWIDVKT